MFLQICGYCFDPCCPDGGGTAFVRVAGKTCLGCISETFRCKMLMLGRDIGWGFRCARYCVTLI